MTSMTRADLAQFFGKNPRLLRAFEDQARAVTENAEGLKTTATATKSLQDAGVIVLAPNEEFTNERVLQIGRGLSAIDDGQYLTIRTSDNVPLVGGGFLVNFAVGGNANLVLPLTGTLSTLANPEVLSNKTLAAPKVSGLGNYADDAAAAAGGVAVGSVYRNGSALMVRVA